MSDIIAVLWLLFFILGMQDKPKLVLKNNDKGDCSLTQVSKITYWDF